MTPAKQYKDFFAGKRITVMGLGLLGGLGDIRFLAECGADLIVTDLKKESDLTPSLAQLKEFSNITYTLGEHKFEDFRDRDLVIKAPATPIDSPYVAEAHKNNIPVTMWAALFSRFAKEAGTTIVGITGTRGKTTTTAMIAETLKHAGKKVIVGGNVQGSSILSQLPEAGLDTIAVLELDSWKIQGFRDEKISPHVGVFTTFYPDHLNYYGGSMDLYLDDKAVIFLFQTPQDVLVLGEQCADIVEKKYSSQIKSKKIIAEASHLPALWRLKVPGEHNRYNAACALEALRSLGLSDTEIRAGLEEFSGVPGRIELVRDYKGIKIYNDTTATTPEATIAALTALDTESKKNIVLIMGGADKNLDMTELLKEIPHHTKKVFLLAGTGTERIKNDLADASVCPSLKEAVEGAMALAGEGDIILLSPAFASYGMFKNEYDRGDQFNTLIAALS
jgi:UDP-N-acetylmuramoylalanine--D-glutamate ligase